MKDRQNLDGGTAFFLRIGLGIINLQDMDKNAN